MRIFKLLIILLLVTGFCDSLYSQALNNDILAARKKREQGLYLDAAVYYENYLKDHPGNKEVNTELAEMLFFEQKDYERAYPYMKKVITYEPDTISYYHALARIEHYNGNLDQAASMYKKLLNIYVSKETTPIIEDAKLGLQQIDYYKANKDKVRSPYLHVVNLGTHINSPYPEYVPVVAAEEDFVMFTSRRKNEFNKFPDIDDDMFHEDMYMARRKGRDFDSAMALPSDYVEAKEVENSKAHESIVSLSPDGKILFIYKLGTLWRSDLVNGRWSAPVQVGKEMISKDYVNHVSITEDGKTIYYTSEKKSSKGNLDIYRAEMKSDGSWTNADNLGNVINSPGSEQSPYITADGKTLYFSSNGHGGYGGYDIFKSTWNGREWSKPENMGMPYNSISDDVFFCPKKDLTEGFFSSNRKGGVGSYDIYRYYFADIPSFDQPDIVVVDKKENIETSATKSTMQWIKERASDPATEKMFFRVNGTEVTDDASKVEKMIAGGKVQKLEVEQVKKCAGCAYKTSNFYSTTDPTTDAMLAVNITTPVDNSGPDNANTNTTGNNENAGVQKFVVYFGFNSKELTKEATDQLTKAADQLRSNENLTAEVTGYADYKGSAGYNKNLSYKRAGAVKKFLTENDVKKKRVKKVIAGGELETDANCMGKPCEEEQNAKNRRVEITISPR